MKKIDCFNKLESLVSEKEIKEYLEKGVDEFPIDAHFGLGGWIRNNWIYPETTEADEVRALFFSKDDYRLSVPDMASSAIISEFYQYLTKKYKVKSLNTK